MKQKIEKFLNSDYLFVILAAVLFFGWRFKIIEISYIVLCIVASLTFFCCKNLSPLALLMCLACCVKYKSFDFTLKFCLIVLPFALMVLAGLIYYVVVNFVKTKTKMKKGNLWFGFLLAFFACSLAGLFSPDFSFLSVLGGMAFALFSYFAYFILINTTGENFKTYLYKILITICALAIFETFSFYYPFNEYFFEQVFKKSMNIGWLMTNSAATLYSIVMPFTLYQSTKSKSPWLHYSFFIILCGGLILTLSRTALLFAGILIPFAVIYTFFKVNGKAKLQMILSFIIGILCFVLFYFAYKSQMDNLIKGMLNRGAYLNSRDIIWDYCYNNFKEYPSFGTGFLGEDKSGLGYSWKLLHNTPLQILCCSGIVGAFLFIPFFYQRYCLLIKKFSLFKLYCLFAVFLWELGGLFDINFIRIFELIIIYTIMAACENESNLEPFKLTITKSNAKIISKVRKNV